MPTYPTGDYVCSTSAKRLSGIYFSSYLDVSISPNLSYFKEPEILIILTSHQPAVSRNFYGEIFSVKFRANLQGSVHCAIIDP